MVVAGYYEQLEFIKELCPGVTDLTVKQCADIMGLDIRTVYNMTKRVKDPLPVKKVGAKKVVIPIPALARWLCLRR